MAATTWKKREPFNTDFITMTTSMMLLMYPLVVLWFFGPCGCITCFYSGRGWRGCGIWGGRGGWWIHVCKTHPLRITRRKAIWIHTKPIDLGWVTGYVRITSPTKIKCLHKFLSLLWTGGEIPVNFFQVHTNQSWLPWLNSHLVTYI